MSTPSMELPENIYLKSDSAISNALPDIQKSSQVSSKLRSKDIKIIKVHKKKITKTTENNQVVKTNSSANFLGPILDSSLQSESSSTFSFPVFEEHASSMSSFPAINIEHSQEIEVNSSTNSTEMITVKPVSLETLYNGNNTDTNVSDKSQAEFSCDCGAKFLKMKWLVKHQNQCTILFNCDLCGKTFKTAKILKKHKTKIHNKPFKCNNCREGF